MIHRSSNVIPPNIQRPANLQPTSRRSTNVIIPPSIHRSPTVETPTIHRPLHSLSIPVPILCQRIIQPVGIQAQQHQIAALEHVTYYDVNVMIPIAKALDFFCTKCVMCCFYKKEEWRYHELDNCRGQNGTNFRDPMYKTFRTSTITLPPGWCYGCLVPQVCRTISNPYTSLLKHPLERQNTSICSKSC